MKVEYKTNQLRKQCEDPKKAQKKYGKIDELDAINIVRIEEVADYHGKQKR